MRRDLALVVALACAALVAALVAAPVWLRAPLLVPLVLVLPGYAIVANFFRPHTISPAERGLYAITLSIATAVISGLIVQIAIGLSRDAWAVLLAAIAVAAAIRGIRAAPREPAQAPAMPWGPALALAAFLTAALATGLAIASAGDGLREAQAKIRFTNFWLIPPRPHVTGAAAESVTVGLRSHEGKRAKYQLRLRSAGRTLASQNLSLVAGERWERSYRIAANPPVPVVATLIRDGKPYRHLDVTLQK